MWTDTTRAICPCRAGFAKRLDRGRVAAPEPFFPPPSHVGRPRKWPLRRIVEAILESPAWRPTVADAAVLFPAGLDGASLV